MKFSKGANLTAGVANTILTVPTGYDCVVSMLFIANVSGSPHNVGATWHDGVSVPFLAGKNVHAGDFIQFGGPEGAFLVMKEGDYITITPESSSSFSSIISFDMYPAAPRLNL